MHIASANADVNLELVRVTGLAGIGLHQIRFDMRATAVPPSRLRGAYALVDGSMEFGGNTGFKLAGQLRVDRPLHFPAADDTNVETTVTLLWELNREQLEAIELVRGDQQPYLRANIRFHLFRPGQDSPAYAWGTENLNITAAVWAKILEQAGYADVLVVLLPMPAPNSGGAWSEAVAELRKARTLVIEGRYEQAVAVGRHVLELLAQVHPLVSPIKEKQKRNKPERFDAILMAVENLADAAHHKDAVTRRFKWERQDAVAVINLLASLMHWLAPSHST